MSLPKHINLIEIQFEHGSDKHQTAITNYGSLTDYVFLSIISVAFFLLLNFLIVVFATHSGFPTALSSYFTNVTIFFHAFISWLCISCFAAAHRMRSLHKKIENSESIKPGKWPISTEDLYASHAVIARNRLNALLEIWNFHCEERRLGEKSPHFNENELYDKLIDAKREVQQCLDRGHMYKKRRKLKITANNELLGVSLEALREAELTLRENYQRAQERTLEPVIKDISYIDLEAEIRATASDQADANEARVKKQLAVIAQQRAASHTP
jgi:hypothetical protein